MIPGLTPQQKETFLRDGLVVVEDFLSPQEVDQLREACRRLVDQMTPQDKEGSIFSTEDHQQANDLYFLESGDKVRFFFEKDSFEADGKLRMEPWHCMNKIGHALHWWVPEFKSVTFSSKTQRVARDLDFQDPVVVQGMYIFKQPKVGSQVMPHQDATFLSNDPSKLVGFWFPIDDATVDNGCLWFVPGSHVRPVSRRFVRNRLAFEEDLLTLKTTAQQAPQQLLIFEGEEPEVPQDQWLAAPVKRGSLVVIHGQVVHKSHANLSDQPRHAFTFHMVEHAHNYRYSRRNWLQPTPEMPFPKLFQQAMWSTG